MTREKTFRAYFWFGLFFFLLGVYDGWGAAGLHWLGVVALLCCGVAAMFGGLVGIAVLVKTKKSEPQKEAKPKQDTSEYVEVN